MNPTTHTLYPVILPVPAEVRDYKPRERVVFLSRHARQALKRSARKIGVELGKLEKDIVDKMLRARLTV